MSGLVAAAGALPDKSNVNVRGTRRNEIAGEGNWLQQANAASTIQAVIREQLDFLVWTCYTAVGVQDFDCKLQETV